MKYWHPPEPQKQFQPKRPDNAKAITAVCAVVSLILLSNALTL